MTSNGGRTGRASLPCREHGCPNLQPCDRHPSVPQRTGPRGTTTQQGYGYAWRQIRERFLSRNPQCSWPDGCDRPATVADHYPVSRRALIAQGVTNPDADEHLRALCSSHHSQWTATERETGPHWMDVG